MSDTDISVPIFYEGQRVETKSHLTKGTIVHITEDGHLDILGDTGNRYRNCMAFAWEPSPIEPETNLTEKPLARKDPVHIIYHYEGEYIPRNGWIIALRPTKYFIMFDDLDSHEVAKEWVARGHGENSF